MTNSNLTRVARLSPTAVTSRALVSALILLTAVAAHAADSPQFRGPHRTGVFDETGLLKAWPENGPPTVWTTTGFGVGFSSAVVVKGKIYLTGTLADQDSYVFILSMDGKIIDKIPYGKETTAEMAPGARSTPTIDGDQLYVLSGLGELNCIDLPTKKIVWHVNILDRFKAPNNEWHVAESLLIDGDHVICTPGGPDAVMAALDKKTGDTVWVTAGMNDMTSYVPPLLVNHNGRKVIFTETSKFLICVDATTGKLLWKKEHLTEYNIHAVTPVYQDGLLFYVAGYKSGGGLLKLSQDASSFTEVWQETDLDCQHHGVVLVDGYLYGASHHKGGGQMVCLDWKTGAVKWFDKTITQAVTEYADGMLYTYEGPKRGIVSLVKPSPDGLQRVSHFAVTAGTKEHWAHPMIANGRLYVRHGDALVCYDIQEKK